MIQISNILIYLKKSRNPVNQKSEHSVYQRFYCHNWLIFWFIDYSGFSQYMFNISFPSTKRIGIDLGTANTLVYVVGEGIVLNEPTVVAVTAEENHVVAVGHEAKDMLGRTPGNVTALRPLRDGVVADYTITEAMLSYFIDKVCGKRHLIKPEVMVCIPSGVTQVERRAVLDATMSAGAKTAYLIDEPLAAAIGAKIPIAQAAGI